SRHAVQRSLEDHARTSPRHAGDMDQRCRGVSWSVCGLRSDLVMAQACTENDLPLDYASNVALYPRFQEYFVTNRPLLLAVWGKNDPSFLPADNRMFNTLGKHPRRSTR